MKILTKIQSISDIITNSSSETFLMHHRDAERYDNLPSDGCISIDAVGEEWIRNNYWERELICNFLNIEEPDDDCFSSEDWNEFVDSYIMPRIDEFDDIYFVEIEDHFEDCCEVLEDAIDDAICWTSRH